MALDLHADPRVVWVRNFRWLFPHYLVLGAMGLGLAVATVELGPLGSALFLAPPLMMRFVLKQYTDRTAGAVERLEGANAELTAASTLLRRRGDELALLSDLGQLAASELRSASLPALVVSRCVPWLGDACALVWRGPDSMESAVHGDSVAHAVTQAISHCPAEWIAALAENLSKGQSPAEWASALGGQWSSTPVADGRDQGLRLLAWNSTPLADDERSGRLELMREVVRRLALVLERDSLLEEAASVDALRAVDAAKSDFIATAAHELRTPLIALQGYTELLRHEVEPSLRDRWLRILHVESAQLGQILDQLLDVSRLDSDHFRAERRAFDVAEVIERPMAASCGW